MSSAQKVILLRQWRATDLEPFAAMNADPEVMRYFPKCFSREESEQSLLRLQAGIAERQWGLWAVEVDDAFAGLTGLNEPKFIAHFTPCVEIAWRFRREFWGKSIAYSAALETMRFAFERLSLSELVSFTAVTNTRSRRLMERLGFEHRPGEAFLHPAIPAENPLRLHALYRKPNPNSVLGSAPWPVRIESVTP
jgi:RimJ/RimL family protein N-acetyltransferase